MGKKDRKLSSFGRNLLADLEGCRKNLIKGELDNSQAREISVMANSSSRALHETLNTERHEFNKAALMA